MKGRLYLFPSTLGESPVEYSLPSHNIDLMRNIRYFIVEEIRSARRFLRKACMELDINDLSFSLLNEHTTEAELPALLEPLQNGYDAGLLSEAGLPCVADPGDKLVRLAMSEGITVVPLAGPSSVYLALMASGMNGQNFAFTGYLPIGNRERAARIRHLESEAWHKDQTQIFIETPYRNNQLLQALIASCRAETRICVAVNLTLEDEWICTQSVQKWRAGKIPDLNKKPAVFLLYH